MKAVRYSRFGGPEVLEYCETPTPATASGELLVRVRACGVNPIDWKVRDGLFDGFFPYTFPITPCWDVAGEVAAMGEDVVGFEVGDRVFADCRTEVVQTGALVEYLAFPATAFAKIPDRISFSDAAALPSCALTAWEGLCGSGTVNSGDMVLIHAGAGGVGSIAIPLAKHLGATVITTASAANTAYCVERGADHVIDYRNADVVAEVEKIAPSGLDLVLNALGMDAEQDAYGLLKKGGCLVNLNHPPNIDALAVRNQSGTFLNVMPDESALSKIASLVETGSLPLPEVKRFPFDAAIDAIEEVKLGHTRGKLVITLG